MHEISIAAGILSAAQGVSQGKKIKKINLVIGELAGIEEECLNLCWELITENTNCAKSVLNINWQYASLMCQVCGEVFPLKGNRSLMCPKCGGEGRLKDRANEQYIESIETADETGN